jgi:tetratricopeptide (TPR) repeat protein
MQKDIQNLEITTDSPEAVARINQFIHQALSYGSTAKNEILAAISADPTCAIAHAYAAAYYLSLENSFAWQQAVPHLKLAQRYANKSTLREKLYISAITAWANGNIQKAVELHEQITDQFPRDLLATQQGQYHYFYMGDSKKLLKIAEKVLPANSQNHFLYGMLAFGLEQCHQLNKAEAVARQAIAINRCDPWAHHAISHVMETQGRLEEGITWMEHYADTWDNCNSMLYTHNWWHIALYYLALGDTQRVLQLYDQHVWGKAQKNSPKDQVGAIALLIRLELQGVNIKNQWQGICPNLLPRIHEHALPFQDLHYVYALARTGQSELVHTMLESMQSHIQTIEPSLQKTWAEVAIPAAKGMIAHAQKEWSIAVSLMESVLPELYKIGGSHAQRQLFEQLYVNALFQSEASSHQLKSVEKPFIQSHRSPRKSRQFTTA